MNKRPKNITLSDDARTWADGVDNASGYIDRLLMRERYRYLDAIEALSVYSRAQLMAAMESIELGEFLEETRRRWGLPPKAWQAIQEMNDHEEGALDDVAEEYWLGRSLG